MSSLCVAGLYSDHPKLVYIVPAELVYVGIGKDAMTLEAFPMINILYHPRDTKIVLRLLEEMEDECARPEVYYEEREKCVYVIVMFRLRKLDKNIIPKLFPFYCYDLEKNTCGLLFTAEADIYPEEFGKFLAESEKQGHFFLNIVQRAHGAFVTLWKKKLSWINKGIPPARELA